MRDEDEVFVSESEEEVSEEEVSEEEVFVSESEDEVVSDVEKPADKQLRFDPIIIGRLILGIYFQHSNSIKLEDLGRILNKYPAYVINSNLVALNKEFIGKAFDLDEILATYAKQRSAGVSEPKSDIDNSLSIAQEIISGNYEQKLIEFAEKIFNEFNPSGINHDNFSKRFKSEFGVSIGKLIQHNHKIVHKLLDYFFNFANTKQLGSYIPEIKAFLNEVIRNEVIYSGRKAIENSDLEGLAFNLYQLELELNANGRKISAEEIRILLTKNKVYLQFEQYDILGQWCRNNGQELKDIIAELKYEHKLEKIVVELFTLSEADASSIILYINQKLETQIHNQSYEKIIELESKIIKLIKKYNTYGMLSVPSSDELISVINREIEKILPSLEDQRIYILADSLISNYNNYINEFDRAVFKQHLVYEIERNGFVINEILLGKLIQAFNVKGCVDVGEFFKRELKANVWQQKVKEQVALLATKIYTNPLDESGKYLYIFYLVARQVGTVTNESIISLIERCFNSYTLNQYIGDQDFPNNLVNEIAKNAESTEYNDFVIQVKFRLTRALLWKYKPTVELQNQSKEVVKEKSDLVIADVISRIKAGPINHKDLWLVISKHYAEEQITPELLDKLNSGIKEKGFNLDNQFGVLKEQQFNSNSDTYWRGLANNNSSRSIGRP